MSLSFGQLKEVADSVIKQQKLLDAVVTEARATFGPVISTRTDLSRVCSEILDRSDLLEARGVEMQHGFKTATLKKLLESNLQVARIVAARFLPPGLAKDLAFDRDPDVRYEACKRMPADVLKEAVGNYPADFGVKMLLEKKTPAHDSEHLHMYDKKRMGKAARPETQPEFSDTFYHTHALKAMQDYGTNIEGQWEETYVKRYCASYCSFYKPMGVMLDVDKLYDAVKEVMRKKEDDAMTQGELKRLEKLHRMRESKEVFQQEHVDSAEALMSESMAPGDFVERVNKLFKVREAALPSGLRKHSVGMGELLIPVKAYIPGAKLSYVVENALDSYVSKWNDRQALIGESFKLSWHPDPTDAGRVCFSVTLR